MRSERQPDLSLKVVFVGATNVGKTAFLVRYSENIFRQDQNTIAVDILSKSVELDGRMVNLQFWDTAGHERFRSVVRTYYRDAAAALAIFDLTDQSSFDAIGEWIEEVKQSALKNVIVFLVGNKTDLEARRVVTKEKAEAFARPRDIRYFETSARTGFQVEETMDALIAVLVQGVRAGSYQIGLDSQSFIVDEPPPRGNSCCD